MTFVPLPPHPHHLFICSLSPRRRSHVVLRFQIDISTASITLSGAAAHCRASRARIHQKENQEEFFLVPLRRLLAEGPDGTQEFMFGLTGGENAVNLFWKSRFHLMSALAAALRKLKVFH